MHTMQNLPSVTSRSKHIASTAHSLPFTLPGKRAPILVTFAYTVNMVPTKQFSLPHTSVYPVHRSHLSPHPFAIAGFLLHP